MASTKGTRRWPYWVGGTLITLALALSALTILGGRMGEKVIRETMQKQLLTKFGGTMGFDDVDVSFWTGKGRITRAVIQPGKDGLAKLSMQQIHLELAPYGSIAWDRTIRRLEIRNVRLEMPLADVDKIRPAPLTDQWADELVVLDAEIVLSSPRKLVGESLTLRIDVDRLASGRVRVSRFETALATLRELQATVKVPLAGDTRIALKNNTMSITGAPGLKDTSFAYRPPARPPGATHDEYNKLIIDYIVKNIGDAGMNQVVVSAAEAML